MIPGVWVNLWASWNMKRLGSAMSESKAQGLVNLAAGIGAFVLGLYWLIALAPAELGNRLLDQYGMYGIVLAVLIAAIASSVIAAARVSRWWALVSLAGIIAFTKVAYHTWIALH